MVANMCRGVCVYPYPLVVHEQIDTEAEGEKQFILLKQWVTHIDIERVCKVVSQDLQPEEDTCASVLIIL